MSGQVFDVGSVIEMTMDQRTIEIILEDEGQSGLIQSVGWGTVVTSRDSWVIRTDVQPMVNCDSCNTLRPLEYHQEMVHKRSVAWRFTT